MALLKTKATHRNTREEPYDKMANYYDRIYHRLVDYEADCDFLTQAFRKHSLQRVQRIVDVGCGTGNHAYILAKWGYRVIGIDLSPEMIKVAKGKHSGDPNDPQFWVMDMRKFELTGKFDAVLSMFGGFGYIHRDSEVSGFMTSTKKHLREGGLLIFEFWHTSGLDADSSTPAGRIRWVRIVEDATGQVIIRLDKSVYDAQTNLLTMTFDHYVVDPGKQLLVEAFAETHATRLYSISEIKHLLAENGLTPLAFYAGDGDKKAMKPATQTSFRVLCVSTPSP